ncbi:unnamed protein product [Paramecium pentaurelia]|uniref:Uncharacterized protein n=1 Tax=Paramecium pentaurelia TaxID=43138 RepID=A0A8S1WKY9_9CILI|nr:unnamed protein product [Paramecium pentaurelia]
MNFINRFLESRSHQLLLHIFNYLKKSSRVEKVGQSLEKWKINKPEFIALIINSLERSLIQTQNLAVINKNYSQTPITILNEYCNQNCFRIIKIGNKGYLSQQIQNYISLYHRWKYGIYLGFF